MKLIRYYKRYPGESGNAEVIRNDREVRCIDSYSVIVLAGGKRSGSTRRPEDCLIGGVICIARHSV